MPDEKQLEKLDAEIARLQHTINVSSARIEDLRMLRLLFTRYYDVFDTSPVSIEKSAADLLAKLALGGKRVTKQEAIISGCKEILADGKRRFSRDLLIDLERRGVMVGGKNPKSNLASYLSHDDAFQADTKLGGWTLRSLIAPKAKASSALTLPAFSTNGASQGRHQLAGLPREGGLQFD